MWTIVEFLGLLALGLLGLLAVIFLLAIIYTSIMVLCGKIPLKEKEKEKEKEETDDRND